MQKWVIFSKQYRIHWLIGIGSGLVVVILDRLISKFFDISIIVSAAVFLFNILIFRIPIWILLAVALVGFILYRIKRRELDERQKFILSVLDDREVGLSDLAVVYKKRWPNEGRIKTKCAEILMSLERLKLVELGCFVGGVNTVQEERLRTTDKGKKRLKKIEDNLKEKAEEIFEQAYREIHSIFPMDEEIESNMEDIIFILKIPANDEDKKALKSHLRNNYTNHFRDKNLAHFNYIWSVLESKRLIEQSRGITGYGGSHEELPFYITYKGLQLYHYYEKTILGK